MDHYFEQYFVRSFWYQRSPTLLRSTLIKRLCRKIHSAVKSRQNRIPLAPYTRFFRNRPQLAVLGKVVSEMPKGARLGLAVLGCSTGAELYSAVFTIAEVRPDIVVDAIGLDISSAAINVAREGRYGLSSREMQGVSEMEQSRLFDREGTQLIVKNEFARRTRWSVANACDSRLVGNIGRQDIVFANNFLIHLSDRVAAECFRNVVQLVRPSGFLFAWGCDLDVRSKLVSELKLNVVDRNIMEVHNADESALRLYPWLWWTLEPIDTDKPEWKQRYGTVFRIS